MATSSQLLTRSILIGVLLVASAYGAAALTVKRTNQLIDGVYAPVLIVTNNGKTTVHLIGQDGLTRAILFDQGRALAWARKFYGAELISVPDGSGDDDADAANDAGGGY